jgi:hypothetical protein
LHISRFAAFSLCLISGLCHASRITGTYVAHGPNFAEMLQLTQTDNGQVNGVLSSLELKADGNVKSEQIPVSGTCDAEQLTLNIGSGLQSFLEGRRIAGTIKSGAIQIQTVDSKGNVASSTFVRSTIESFKAYTDQLKSKGQRFIFNNTLMRNAERYQQTVQNAEKWITEAESHVQQIPRVKERYTSIEGHMRLLISQEQRASDPVARGQLSVSVNQTDVAATQTDIHVDQLWDVELAGAGSQLNTEFAEWDGNCGTPEKLQNLGATAQTIGQWMSACKQALREREKFGPIFKEVSQQRADLKSFQTVAQAHRKALVNEADRMQ